MQREGDDRPTRAQWLRIALFFIVETMVWQTILLVAGMLIYGFVGVVRHLAKGATSSPRQLRFRGVYLVTALLCCGNFWITNRVWAPAMAEEIGEACKAYHADHGEYPAELEELTPDYLPVVPPAKFTIFFNEFEYSDAMGVPYLLWYEFPPFGRPNYDIADRRWGYVD